MTTSQTELAAIAQRESVSGTDASSFRGGGVQGWEARVSEGPMGDITSALRYAVSIARNVANEPGFEGDARVACQDALVDLAKKVEGNADQIDNAGGAVVTADDAMERAKKAYAGTLVCEAQTEGEFLAEQMGIYTLSPQQKREQKAKEILDQLDTDLAWPVTRTGDALDGLKSIVPLGIEPDPTPDSGAGDITPGSRRPRLPGGVSPTGPSALPEYPEPGGAGHPEQPGDPGEGGTTTPPDGGGPGDSAPTPIPDDRFPLPKPPIGPYPWGPPDTPGPGNVPPGGYGPGDVPPGGYGPGDPGSDGGHADGDGYGTGGYGSGSYGPGSGGDYGTGGYGRGSGYGGVGGYGVGTLGGTGAAGSGSSATGAFGASGSYGPSTSSTGATTPGTTGSSTASGSNGMPMMGGQGGAKDDKKKRKPGNYIAWKYEPEEKPEIDPMYASALRAGNDRMDFTLPDIEDPEDQW